MRIGVIGGSGFYTLDGNTAVTTRPVATPYQDAPVTVYSQTVGGHDVDFLPRHGAHHGVPPHRVNYRANISALRDGGVEAIIAVNVVGGISSAMAPGTLLVPDQVIDYTWGREHTFFDTLENPGNHVDFTWPYDAALGKSLVESAAELGVSVIAGGVYGCTQGPRLETAAEIARLARDGCDVVGMTGMPEAALAREAAIPYVSIALVVNWGAGLTAEEIAFAEIAATLEQGTQTIRRIVLATIEALP